VGDAPGFRSTVPYYVRHRPRYPAELIAQLAATAGLDGSGRVLDLGAGPGHVAIPLAAHAVEVVAVDPEPEMLAALAAAAPANVRALEGRAEDVDESWGTFALATAGRSFHWFDAELVFERLARVTPQLALLGDWVRQDRAQSTVVDLALEVLGEPPRTREPRRYRALLEGSPFADVTELSVVEERTWTREELIGLAYSTSVASRERLGERSAEFERLVHERLPEVSRERVRVDAVLGRQR
jgi:SAM-dependent methyltransferase